MATAAPELEALIHDLPPALRLEVYDFVEFLLRKRATSHATHLRQDWANAHPSESQPLTSVDLQHRALDWRAD